MINFDDTTNEKKAEHNSNSLDIPDRRYRILKIGGSESGKTNTLLNPRNHQPDIHQIYPLKIDMKQNNMSFLKNVKA